MADATLSSSVPLVYEQVKSQLEERIGRDWRPGDRVPPVRDLARDLGVGLSSTHRAMKELIREGQLDARPGRGTFVRHQKRSNRATPTKTEQVLVAISHEAPDSMILRMIEGIEACLAGTKFEIVRHVYKKDDGPLQLPRETRALMLINPDATRDIQIADDQFLILINTGIEAPLAVGGRYDIVSIDQEQGGFLAGELLRQRGIEEACFLGATGSLDCDQYDKTSEARLLGFERGFGQPLPVTHQFRGGFYGPWTGGKGVVAYMELSPRPMGVFAVSDEVAIGFVSGAYAHGLEPGKHFSIVGFDAQGAARSMAEGPLTSVAVPAERMGREAAELLLSRDEDINQPVRRRGLGCSLFMGSTVQPQVG